MATPNENLARSLHELRQALPDGAFVIKSSELSRVHRERLVASGFLREVLSGWLMLSNPAEKRGESSSWYASFWDFSGRYLNDRFGDAYHLSAESSILMRVGTSFPRQIAVNTSKNINQVVNLPYDCSILIYSRKSLGVVTKEKGVNVMALEQAITEVPESFFTSYPLDAELALKMVRDPSDILRPLLAEGKSVVAGRLAGAYRFLGNPQFADAILATMRNLNYTVRESNPFRTGAAFLSTSRVTSPYAARIRALWAKWRDQVAAIMPAPQSHEIATEEVLHRIEDIYTHDAYNSLSIEGYRITMELIEKVSNGNWNPEGNAADAEQRNAMAARGYWLAFNQVKETVREILEGGDQAKLIAANRHAWFMSLFTPSVQAGIISPANLAGFRTHPVQIRDSLHAPPHRDYLADCMDALNDCMQEESNPAVRAVLGHFFFVYIHPYMDGNGRTARFMMNAVLATSNYPWTVIREEAKDEYFNALEQASVGGEIEAFAGFVASEMGRSFSLKRKIKP